MLIIGCGYIGRALGARYLLEGMPVTGVVATAPSAGQLEKIGISPIVLDLDRDGLTIPPSPEIFYFAPPPGEGDRDPRLRKFLASLEPGVQGTRVVYTSTSGVYGDCDGEWVDETRPVAPVTDRSRRRLDAEQALRDWSRSGGGEAVILRVAGIYGPGRIPLERLRRGMPVLRPAEAPWSNRIHADDLVTVCRAAMENGTGAVYNVSDGHPSTMTDYFHRVADLAGLTRPPELTFAQAEQQLPPGLLSYLRESRRLDNRKMREELGVTLKYPTLAEGLPASL